VDSCSLDEKVNSRAHMSAKKGAKAFSQLLWVEAATFQ
jgi:hypothetical protein